MELKLALETGNFPSMSIPATAFYISNFRNQIQEHQIRKWLPHKVRYSIPIFSIFQEYFYKWFFFVLQMTRLVSQQNVL